jgi:hypothetical protein
MRSAVVTIVLILTAVALRLPAHALSGPMPGSKLQNLASTDIEQVRGFVARGPRGCVVAGRSGYRGGIGYLGRVEYQGGLAYRGAYRPGVRAAGCARAPPVAGYCWYYIDLSGTQGFYGNACP